jgi:hypothetical protein
MSGDRQSENFTAIDQASRSAEPDPQEEVQSEEDYVESMRKQLAELEAADRRREEEMVSSRRQLAEERARRERAEAAVQAADGRAVQATNLGLRTAEEARLGEITTAVEARRGQMDALKSQYQAAFAEGDGGKMASINADMALVGSQITSLEAGQAQLKRRQDEAAAAPPQVQQPSADQVRQQMLQGLNSRERDWVNAHQEYFDNPSFQRRVQAASNYAQEVRGLSRDSQQYIDLINEELGLTERVAPPPRQESRQQERPANAPAGREADRGSSSDRRMVAAPVGGSVPNVSRGGEEPVYLSAQEKELARIQGIPEREYAKHKQDLQREGLIGPGANNRR